MAFKGEAFVGASFQVILEKVATPIIEEIIFRLGIHKEVKRLGKMLTKIQDVLDEAEQEQQQRKPSVEMWLNELKDFAYDVDDVMDEFAFEIEQLKLEGEAETDIIDKVCNLFSSLNMNIDRISFEQKIASKIKDLIERLEELEGTRVTLGLREGVRGRRMEIRKRPETSSVVDDSDFVGREDDRDVLIRLLLDKPIQTTPIQKKHKPSGNNVYVIPIVGMGGLGKTTLVQAVYNDKTVQDHFAVKAWVCVTEEFDVLRLTKAILESANTEKCDLENLDALQVRLQKKLKNERFLLVLDDVWNENQNDWEVLRAPFGVGAPGSRILVTTRSHIVSFIMGTIQEPYDLGGLPEEDCWSLFKKLAFTKGNSNPPEILEIIGKEIVKKCKGSPLAVKTLGGLLGSNQDVEKWEYVLNTEMWNLPAGSRDILPALRLSYHHLPSYLKQCFAYCSIFPKDFEIKKEDLVRMWIAEGFVQPEKGRCPEDTGNEYFDDLFSRSFFQHSSRGKEEYFVMHDLIHDLAQSISGEICCRFENHLSDNTTITERTRHVSLIKFDDRGILKRFYKAKSLRTIYCSRNLRLPHDFFEKLKYLRVMRNCIGISFGMDHFVESISNLKHLRFLELSSDEGLNMLPESIGKLFNLQTLILHYFPELPNSIGNLKKLRYLELFGVKRLPESIGKLLNLHTLELFEDQELPKEIINLTGLRNLKFQECYKLVPFPLGIGKLTNIQRLSSFPVSRESGAKLRELKDMNKLCERLQILGLENVIDADEAKDAHLKNKHNLKELVLKWGNGDSNMREPSVEELVLESLEPHINLEKLNILGWYGGARFPKWMGDQSFSKLKSITLMGGGECCQVLPALGQLPLLIDLEISSVLGLKHMGHEFYGMGKGFPSLETLELKNLAELQEWFDVEEDGDFLRLRDLTISGCPKLKKLPDAFVALKKMSIEKCNELEYLPTFPAVEEFRIQFCGRLADFSTFPALKKLIIISCNGLKGLLTFPALKDLRIRSCDRLVDLPTFPALKNLRIELCKGLVVLPMLPALCYLELDSCDDMILNSLPYLNSLSSLRISGFEKLTAFPEGFLGALQTKRPAASSSSSPQTSRGFLSTTLNHLEISRCPNLEAISLQHEWVSTTLKFLCIKECPIKHLPTGLQNLLSLETLKIWSCHLLESLPEDGLPTTLRHLRIDKCELLESRCREGGEDWPKISHIPKRDNLY